MGVGRGLPFTASLLPCAGGMVPRVLCLASGWDGVPEAAFSMGRSQWLLLSYSEAVCVSTDGRVVSQSRVPVTQTLRVSWPL